MLHLDRGELSIASSYFPFSLLLVSSQTKLTIPTNCDFESLLKQVIFRVSPEPSSNFSNHDFTNLNVDDASNLPRFIDSLQEKSIQLDPDELDENQEPDCTHEVDQAVIPTESSAFLCSSCRKPHHPPPLSRRSLFSESSETIDDTV